MLLLRFFFLLLVHLMGQTDDDYEIVACGFTVKPHRNGKPAFPELETQLAKDMIEHLENDPLVNEPPEWLLVSSFLFGFSFLPSAYSQTQSTPTATMKSKTMVTTISAASASTGATSSAALLAPPLSIASAPPAPTPTAMHSPASKLVSKPASLASEPIQIRLAP